MRVLPRLAGALLMPLLAAACDAVPYDVSAHRQSNDAATGSMLSGTDTGANANGGVGDPSVRSSLNNGGVSGR